MILTEKSKEIEGEESECRRKNCLQKGTSCNTIL
jgi:hypothetical protein